MENTKKLLCEKEVERLYGINIRTLQKERVFNVGIPYLKLNKRIRYHVDDIKNYLDSCKRGKVVRYD